MPEGLSGADFKTKEGVIVVVAVAGRKAGTQTLGLLALSSLSPHGGWVLVLFLCVFALLFFFF